MMKNFFTFVLCSAIAIPAFASATISSPTSGETVTSPFTLSADASSCSSQPVSSMGYSLDDSPDTTLFHGDSSINTKVDSSTGKHTVHVKVWSTKGAVCVTDVSVDVASVTNDVTANSSIVPSSAISVSGIHALSNWKKVHDSGTPGSSTGSTSLVASPSHSGSSRKFATSFSNSGGERYSVSFGDDRTSTYFLYDAWIYVASPSTKLANLELDLYQTMSSGETVLFGLQCSGYSGTWEYTHNTGTASHPKGVWTSSSAKCNPRSWTTGKWHHVQLEYSRSGATVTYHAVWLDGVKSTLGKTAFSGHNLGWGSSLLTQFQVDGVGTGSATLYLGGLTLYRW